jgi:outer membrane lipoprotein-sorting protein
MIVRALASIVATVLLLSPLAVAQENALQLLQKVAANHGNFQNTTYEFEQSETRDSEGLRTEHRTRVVGSGPRFREEARGVVYLFDGQHRWAYNTDRNEYVKVAAPSGGSPTSLIKFLISGSRVKSARFLHDENVELRSGPVVCQVIEVEREPVKGQTHESPTIYWIDARRHLILKSQYNYTSTRGEKTSTTTITTSFTKLTVGEPVDETLLRFTPPAGAVHVDRLSFGPKSKLIGTDTPDFELKGADGKPISSSSFKGRAVLLYFGRGPDDDELLSVEMLHRALKNNGLMALYVVPSTRTDGTRIPYTVAIATDLDETAARKLGITYKGMVLIDGLGKIAWVGDVSRGSLEFARALQSVGLW